MSASLSGEAHNLLTDAGRRDTTDRLELIYTRVHTNVCTRRGKRHESPADEGREVLKVDRVDANGVSELRTDRIGGRTEHPHNVRMVENRKWKMKGRGKAMKTRGQMSERDENRKKRKRK